MVGVSAIAIAGFELETPCRAVLMESHCTVGRADIMTQSHLLGNLRMVERGHESSIFASDIRPED